MTEILAFLALFNMTCTDYIITPSNETFFLAGDIPVIYLAPHMNKPRVVMHEIVHCGQWYRAGKRPAANMKEWQAREDEAKKIESMFVILKGT